MKITILCRVALLLCTFAFLSRGSSYSNGCSLFAVPSWRLAFSSIRGCLLLLTRRAVDARQRLAWA